MEFAERMLKKYGWDAGKYILKSPLNNWFENHLDKGLGKDNQGMKAAITPVLKFDTRGVSWTEVKWTRWKTSFQIGRL